MTAGPPQRSAAREYSETLLITAILMQFIWVFVFQAFKIPTPSMVDNLLVGDHIFVNKFIFGPADAAGMKSLFGFRDVRRGDIIVFRFPPNPAADYVKRVIGLPGETVVIRDKKLFIEGRELAEPYTIHRDPRIFPAQPSLPLPYRQRDQFGPYTVPQGTYFVMGDNRDESYDSRYWGPVPRAMIKGKPFFVYWSFRSEPMSTETTGLARLRELAGVVRYFFSRTRWNRTFFVVDSRYHYSNE